MKQTKTNKPKRKMDEYIVQALDILVPNQAGRYETTATGILEVWEAHCYDLGRKAVTKITKNGKEVYQSIYNYDSGKYTKKWF